MQSEIHQTYGNRLRVRVCGLLFENDKLLLIRHLGLGEKGFFWSPVGGGVNFGEKLEAALQREFLEETGLEVIIEKYLFTYQFIQVPLHALEFFFLVKRVKGVLQKGFDPEMQNQIIDKVQFLTFDQIQNESAGSRHGIFSGVRSFEELLAIKGLVG